MSFFSNELTNSLMLLLLLSATDMDADGIQDLVLLYEWNNFVGTTEIDVGVNPLNSCTSPSPYDHIKIGRVF